jgi:hypothetical protein
MFSGFFQITAPPPPPSAQLICGFSGEKKNIKFYFWTKHRTRKNSFVS